MYLELKKKRREKMYHSTKKKDVAHLYGIYMVFLHIFEYNRYAILVVHTKNKSKNENSELFELFIILHTHAHILGT